MPRGVRKQVEYTGKAAKAQEKVLRLQEELQQARRELKAAYREQLREEKAAAGKKAKEDQAILLRAFKNSGKSVEEVLQAIGAQ